MLVVNMGLGKVLGVGTNKSNFMYYWKFFGSKNIDYYVDAKTIEVAAIYDSYRYNGQDGKSDYLSVDIFGVESDGTEIKIINLFCPGTTSDKKTDIIDGYKRYHIVSKMVIITSAWTYIIVNSN